MNFIKNIEDKKTTEWEHRKFTRYSKGVFKKENLYITLAKQKITLSGGFEYIDAFFELVASVINEDITLSGTVVSQKAIAELLNEFKIEPLKVTGKKYTIKEIMSAERFKEFVKMFNGYYLLLSGKSKNFSISVKKSVPKPGKPVEKFITIKIPKIATDIVKSEWLYDLEEPISGKYVIKHTYIVEDIIIDKELIQKEPSQARLQAQRIGRIHRVVEHDNQILVNREFKFKI